MVDKWNVQRKEDADDMKECPGKREKMFHLRISKGFKIIKI